MTNPVRTDPHDPHTVGPRGIGSDGSARSAHRRAPWDRFGRIRTIRTPSEHESGASRTSNSHNPHTVGPRGIGSDGSAQSAHRRAPWDRFGRIRTIRTPSALVGSVRTDPHNPHTVGPRGIGSDGSAQSAHRRPSWDRFGRIRTIRTPLKHESGASRTSNSHNPHTVGPRGIGSDGSAQSAHRRPSWDRFGRIRTIRTPSALVGSVRTDPHNPHTVGPRGIGSDGSAQSAHPWGTSPARRRHDPRHRHQRLRALALRLVAERRAPDRQQAALPAQARHRMGAHHHRAAPRPAHRPVRFSGGTSPNREIRAAHSPKPQHQLPGRGTRAASWRGFGAGPDFKTHPGASIIDVRAPLSQGRTQGPQVWQAAFVRSGCRYGGNRSGIGR